MSNNIKIGILSHNILNCCPEKIKRIIKRTKPLKKSTKPGIALEIGKTILGKYNFDMRCSELIKAPLLVPMMYEKYCHTIIPGKTNTGYGMFPVFIFNVMPKMSQ